MKEEIPEDPDMFDLNEKRLDTEWQRQPKLYFEWATKLADARRELEQAKAAKELAAAEIAKDIRADPVAYDLPKVTENSVEACVLQQAKYQLHYEKYMRAKYRVDITLAVVDALEHRKKALENLVHLFGMNYFSEPKGPRGMRGEEVQDLSRKMSGKDLGVSREEAVKRRKHSG